MLRSRAVQSLLPLAAPLANGIKLKWQVRPRVRAFSGFSSLVNRTVVPYTSGCHFRLCTMYLVGYNVPIIASSPLGVVGIRRVTGCHHVNDLQLSQCIGVSSTQTTCRAAFRLDN